MEADIWQAYQASHPGQVQVLGIDLWNGSAAQVMSFKTQTGATYPLLLQGSAAAGGNITTLYGTYDNYIVIDKLGIVRYHAADGWPHGNRYHLNEIIATVDQYVSDPAGVGDDPAAGVGLAILAAPNPFRSLLQLSVEVAGDGADPLTVTVFDTRGRIVRELVRARPTLPGEIHVTWDGRRDDGTAAPAGRYWIRVRAGDRTGARGVVLLP